EREEGMRRWEGNRGPEPIRTRYERLLALFATIEKAELRIDRVSWCAADADGYPARVRLLVRGTRADGIRATLEQAATLRVAPRDGRWRITREDVTARTLVTRRTPRFARVTDAAGIASVHTSDGSPAFRLFGGGPDNPVGASSGVAVADTDGDGCEDVFLAGSPDAVLYRNRCDGTFSDVTAASGLPHPYPATATGAVFFDYDNDGWPDLFVAAARGGDRLFHNTGGGHFVDVSAAAGIPPWRWASMAAVAAYDRDGFLHLDVVGVGDQEATVPRANYAPTNRVPRTLSRNHGDGTLTDVTPRARPHGPHRARQYGLPQRRRRDVHRRERRGGGVRRAVGLVGRVRRLRQRRPPRPLRRERLHLGSDPRRRLNGHVRGRRSTPG